MYRYFTSEIEISPSKVSFGEAQLLIAKFDTIRISNKQRKKDIDIKAILSSSPELSFYIADGIKFPIKLKPNEHVEI